MPVMVSERSSGAKLRVNISRKKGVRPLFAGKLFHVKQFKELSFCIRKIYAKIEVRKKGGRLPFWSPFWLLFGPFLLENCFT